MVKVKAHGIEGKILGWIDDWLSGRKQRVILNGRESNWIDVWSGVPQGFSPGTGFVCHIHK